VNFKHDESATKLKGAYYTPPALARWLVRWALAAPAARRKPVRVLEPGCGDGVFLEALGESSRALEVDALEIDPLEAKKARARGGDRVLARDFFGWLADEPPGRTWDVVLGNPPYIRYQYFDAGPREVATRLCREAGVPISKLTNAWVPFVLLSARRLAPGGRLAMVVPAELMHVLHAEGLRRELEKGLGALTVVHVRAMLFDALQGVVLLLAEKGPPAGCRPRILEVDGVAALPPPEAIEPDLAGLPGEARRGRWMWALLEDDERALLERIEGEGWAPLFRDLASVDVGIVTGANDFFVTDEATVRAHGLEPFVLPMLGRSEHVRGILYSREDHEQNRREGRRVSFLSLPPGTRLPASVKRYLATGEEQGLPSRFKCRIREPWWAVPYVWRAPVALLKRCHGSPRLVLNEAEAFTTDTAYRICPREGVHARDLVGSFQCSLTFLLAELEGRHYGGGVLELVPSEIERLRIPLRKTSAAELDELDGLVRAGSIDGRVLDRADELCLGEHLSREERALLRRAWVRLRDRRQRRVKAP
jgi:adenine-specific DNA methylase